MTPDEKAELRKAAEEATPGPWQVYEQHLVDQQQAVQEFETLINGQSEFWPVLPMLTDGNMCPAVTGCGPKSAANAAFIAAANPATVLALLDENARLAAEVERLTRWIPCSERMPEEEEFVLAWDDDGILHQAAWFEAYEPDDGTIVWRTDSGRALSSATHWMPLPEPPK